MNASKTSGEAWDKLGQIVDGLVETLIEENKLPGMTVAVTKGGRLLLRRGYGFALVDGSRKLPMTACSRGPAGSVSKATATGPCAVQLMKAKNIDPETRKLYGPGGFFGGKFDPDIDIGIEAHAPQSAPWKLWYPTITFQHLLDHKSGFTLSGDTKGAADMFDVPEEELTYEQVHRHFLRTRELLHEPGTKVEYSNHGFGALTMLIEKLSGKSYPDYVREDYLEPMKLHGRMRPQRAHPDSCDAHKHRFVDGALEPVAFENAGLGLAAGGFVASAEDLMRVTTWLDKKYTVEQLDRMGWGATSKGKLSHSGATSDGMAFVAMFPENYVSSSGADLSEVHVAVMTNVRKDGIDLGGLAGKIALAVPDSAVPASFDLWKPGKSCSCEYARHGVPANEYQKVFDEAAGAGYRLEWIEGYAVGGKVYFNVVFRTNEPKIAWASHHNMTAATYQQKFDHYRGEGFSPDHVDSYAVGNDVLYSAIWTKSGGAFNAYHGKTADEHQQSFDSLIANGWRPKVISVASIGGTLRYTALYDKQAIGSFEARSSLGPDEYQSAFDQNAARGWHLHYLGTFVHSGKLRFSAIWADKPEVFGSRARHGLTAQQLETAWQDALSAGFRTRAISGYEDGGKVRYAAYWTKSTQ